MPKIINALYYEKDTVLQVRNVGKVAIVVVKKVYPYFHKLTNELCFKYYVKSVEEQVGSVLIPTFFVYPDQVIADVSHCFDENLKPTKWKL